MSRNTGGTDAVGRSGEGADAVSLDAGRPGGRRTRRPGGDRGSVAIEYLGFLPVLLLVALAGVQLGLVAYAGVQAGTAARAAARTDSAAAGAASASGWLKPRIGMDEGADRVTATVTVTVPSVLPGISFLDPVTRSATMPRD
ncbi:TadE/TadG family type IV pilus assembly protein [Streptomyces sp. ICBB 8177]|uniref:TadE/TadG family type IV pilus assembly protein n=1 Tax=Streptomyces sp. ICBB 8177 TaxID=563922 RepID=UPI000D67224F|nr:TadE/TadG family type IV pilus assembly protein [Streptomyces sp. ICBB 8177]PWI43862.1 septum formation initiator [Streptomyces sp. ICBB 8177]